MKLRKPKMKVTKEVLGPPIEEDFLSEEDDLDSFFDDGDIDGLDTNEIETKGQTEPDTSSMTNSQTGTEAPPRKSLSKYGAAIKHFEKNLATSNVINHKSGRKQKFLDVKIAYDPNNTRLDQSEMIREIVAMRGIIPEGFTDLKRCSEYLHQVGNVPFYILAQDEDRYHKCIFAIETLRQAGDKEALHYGLKFLRKDPNYDLSAPQPQYDGTQWGDLSEYNVPVRDQIEKQKQKTTLTDTGEVAPSDPAYSQDAPMIIKWKNAEKHAEGPKETWEGKVPWEFEQMIRYCHNWIRQAMVVPQPYPKDLLDIFWPAMRVIEMSPEANERRNQMVNKVMVMWKKSVTANRVPGLDLYSQSYRVILAAKKLEHHIEVYVHDPSEKHKLTIRDCAIEYFNAHFPVQVQGAKPGPIDTLDPDYVGYLRLCHKYKLKEGTLLHEAKL